MSSLKQSDCSVYKTPSECNKFKENCEWDVKIPKKGPLNGINIFKYSKGKCIHKKKASATKKASAKKKANAKKKATSLKKNVIQLEALKIKKASNINKMLIKNGIHEEFEDILKFINKYPKKSDEEIVKMILKYTNNRKIRDSGPYTKKPDWSGSWNPDFHHSHWRSVSSSDDEGGGGIRSEKNSRQLYKLSKKKQKKFKLNTNTGKWVISN